MISIVVVTYNRKVFLKRCLESLFTQSYSKEYEVIVIDNNSTDGTQELIQNEYSTRVKFIRNQMRQNVSTCKNLGVKMAQGAIIAFIDDDCLASRHWLGSIEGALNNYDFVGGAVLPEAGVDFPWWWRHSLDWLVGINPTPNMKFLPLGSNIAFKAYVLKELQRDTQSSFIDTHQYLPYAEDNYRVKRALGFKFSMNINLNMIVYHHIQKQRLRPGYLIKRSYREGDSWVSCEREFRIFLLSFIKLIVNPVRLLISGDIDYLFRTIVSVSYIVSYIRRPRCKT